MARISDPSTKGLTLDDVPIPASVFANDLAGAFFAFVGRDAEERSEDHDVVMLAAESLAEDGHPGDWERFDAAGFFQRVAFVPDAARHMMAFDLVALFVYLSMIEWVAPKRAIHIVNAIEKSAVPLADLNAVAARAREAIQALASLSEPEN